MMQCSWSSANGPARSADRARRAFRLLTLAIAIGWHGGAAAQDVDTVQIGTRVKVTGTTPAPIVGEVHSLSADTLFVASPDGMVSPVPWSAVSRLQLSVGNRRNTLRGAVIGFATATVVSAILAFGTEPTSDLPQEAGLLLGAVFLGLPSAGIGALIGRGVWSEHWRDVPIPCVRPSVVALPDGRVGVGVRYRH